VDSNNRLFNVGLPAFSYDGAGNMTGDGVSGNQYAYDAETRIVSVNSGAATYYYDADGLRDLKTVGGNTTEYVYFKGQPMGRTQV
jgi:hypothetical protein